MTHHAPVHNWQHKHLFISDIPHPPPPRKNPPPKSKESNCIHLTIKDCCWIEFNVRFKIWDKTTKDIGDIQLMKKTEQDEKDWQADEYGF